MEDRETKAIPTAPMHCTPTLWKWYVDDILEITKSGHTQEVTDHLNNMDDTGNIQFTHEEQINRTISFQDMNIYHRENATLK